MVETQLVKQAEEIKKKKSISYRWEKK